MDNWELFWFYLGRADVWYRLVQTYRNLARTDPGAYTYWDVQAFEALAKARELEEKAFVHAKEAIGV